MPQPKRKAAKAKPKAKPRAKRKPAARRPPEPEIQVNRMTDPQNEQLDPNTFEQPPEEETQEQRDAAGAARAAKVFGSQQDPVEDYEPPRQPLEHAGFDHQAAEDDRQAELEAEREEHNERTGDASLTKGTWS